MHVCVEKGMRGSEGENGISGPLLVQRAITCGAQLSTSFRRIDFPSSERGASMSLWWASEEGCSLPAIYPLMAGNSRRR